MLEQWNNGSWEIGAVGELVLNKVKDWQNPIDKEVHK
jgi:hypothetical protein